jgi:hypothetical protein
MRIFPTLAINRPKGGGGGDIVIPTFTVAPNATNIAYDSYDIEGTCSENCDVYSLLVVRGAAQPSNAVIIATGETDADVGAGFSITHSGLDSGTQYDSWVVAVDTSANESVAVKVEVDTIYLDPALLSSARLILDSDEEYLSIRTAAQFTAANTESLSLDSSNKSFHFGNESFTAVCWAYKNTLATQALMSVYKETGAQRSWHLYFTGANTLNAYINPTGNAGSTTVSDTGAGAGSWHLCALVYDADADLIKVRIDSQPFVTAAHSTGAFAASTSEFAIGASNGLASFHFDGRIDSPAMYGKALTDAELDAIYNSGDGQNYYDIDKTDLISFWSLNETSGTRYDMHGGNHLTDNNTVTYADGKVLDRGQDVEVFNAAQFTKANAESLSSASTDFRFGDTSFSFGFWLYADTTTANGYICVKGSGAATTSFNCVLQSNNMLRAVITNNGNLAGGTTIYSSAIADNTWGFYVIVYDAVADLFKITLNNEAFITGAHSGGAWNGAGAGDLYFGDNDGVGSSPYDGRMDSSFFYNKALSQAEVTTLYNAGAGQNYSEIDKTSLLAFWALDEVSGNRADSHTGGYTLTDNNTVTQAEGHVASTQTLYDISYWNDRSGQGNHFDQATPASRPSYNSVTGKISMVAASTEFLECINGATPFKDDTQGEIIVVAERTNLAQRGIGFGIGKLTSNDDVLLLHHKHDEDYEIFSAGGGAKVYTANDDVNTVLVGNASCNAVRTRMSINDVELPLTVSGGASDWMSATTSPTVAYIGRLPITTLISQEGNILALYYFNAELSTADRDEVMAWINNKYSVYTPITSYADLGANLKLNLNVAVPASIDSSAKAGTAVRGLYDLSQDLALGATRYTADWSTNTNGWSGDGHSAARVAIYEGKTDCLEMTVTTGRITRNNSTANVVIQQAESWTFEYFIPSGQDVDGFQFMSNSGDVWLNRKSTSATPAVIGAWTEVTTDAMPNSTAVRFDTFNGNAGTTAAEAGDVMYVRAYSSRPITGNHFYQFTFGAPPAIGASSIDFDGVGDYLSDALGALFTAISADTQGEWIALFDDDAGAGVDNIMVLVSALGASSHYMKLGLSSANDIYLKYRQAGNNNISFGAATRGVEKEISISSSGTAYAAFDSYVQSILTAGVDDGKWHGDNGNLTMIEIGRLESTAEYYALGLKRLIYINRQLGMDERRQFKKFRDNE